MNSNRQRSNLMRGVMAALWLLGFILVTSTVTVPLLYGLPVLALFSFLLADYFSGFVIAILLTLIVKTLYLDQMPGITRAFIIDALWLTAIVATGIKLLRPFDKTVSEQRVLTKPSTINYRGGELPVNFRHDLQTPISLILGFCNAILRVEEGRGTQIAPQHRNNVQAIYRNAKQLEKMIAELLNQVAPVLHAPVAEELDIALVIQEAATLIQDLMTANGILLDIKTDGALPRLNLNRITIRQVILNVLRTISRLNGGRGSATTVTVRTTVQHPVMHITFTALSEHIRQVATDETWVQNTRLLEIIGGRLWIQEAVDPNTKSLSTVIMALPLPSEMTGITVHRSILIMSSESSVQHFFEEHLNQYRIIGIKDISMLQEAVAQNQPVAIVLTRKQDASYLPVISELVGKQLSIVMCDITTAQELVEQLNVVYLPKPVNYGALFSVLTNAKFPVTHILIVDDNLDSAEMLARMLASMSPAFISWKVYLAQDVLPLLYEQNITAVILDISLPDMDGLTLAQLIRSHARFAHMPIVLISAQQSLETRLPIIVSNTISVFQASGFEPSRLASIIDSLVNASARKAKVSDLRR